MVMNHKNMEKEMQQYFSRELLQSMPTNTMKQLMKCTKTDGEFYSFDGEINYTKSFSRITRPLLAISGGMDQLITPASVEKFFPTISSQDKKHIVLSKENGFEEDYGHADILLGKNVEKEVFPIISDWFKSHIK